MAAAAASTAARVVRPSATAPASVLWAKPSPLRTTGKPIASAVGATSSAPTPPAARGTRSPKAARSAFASASVRSFGSAGRAAGRGEGCDASSGISAADIAASASSMPQNGTMPRSMARRASSSGMFSGSEPISATFTPFASPAARRPFTTCCHSGEVQRSARGKSSTTQSMSSPGSAAAVKVRVIAASSPQM